MIASRPSHPTKCSSAENYFTFPDEETHNIMCLLQARTSFCSGRRKAPFTRSIPTALTWAPTWAWEAASWTTTASSAPFTGGSSPAKAGSAREFRGLARRYHGTCFCLFRYSPGSKIPEQAAIRTWPAVERNRHIYVW